MSLMANLGSWSLPTWKLLQLMSHLNILRLLAVFAMISKAIFVPNLSLTPFNDPLINTNFAPSKVVLPIISCLDSDIPRASLTDCITLTSPDRLHIYFQNINSMRSKICDFKLAVLEEDYDIIAIVETWLYPDILSSEFLFDNSYVTYRRDRCVNKHQRGGGILLAVKSKFISCLIPLKHCEEIEQLCVCISPSTKIT